MPEGYTHVRTARLAAQLAHLQIEYPAAFAQGANGPDCLFGFQAWRPGPARTVNLPALGSRMHSYSTGAFLADLLKTAQTPAQWEYALGFLCHYATDCTVHPYVMEVTRKGQLYHGHGGHGLFEIGLDSYLHKLDTGDGLVPADDASPALAGSVLMEVCTLLRPCLAREYGADVPLDCLMEAFDYTRTLRKLFATRSVGRRLLFRLAGPFVGGSKVIFAHVSPAALRGTDPKDKKKLPSKWMDQYAGVERDADIFVLLNTAERESARLMTAACRWRAGELSLDELKAAIGSNSYDTGTPTKKSTGTGAEVN